MINPNRKFTAKSTLVSLRQSTGKHLPNSISGDFLGAVPDSGTFGIVDVITAGATAFYAANHWSVWALLLVLFVHGTFYAFLLNGFHELCHSTVFKKTKALNTFFLYFFSFLWR